ncbi:MAG TPA: SET domain-containing protein-lysine N-methyltransferase [Rhizomicrobium sp.]|jgi:hypothetical protein|nr:SET domain-containing protein-lysine N-methyltransferase [Rhizomicrobium sp.]
MKTYLPRSWVSPKLAPGKSKIHGAGVIATEAILAGEKLMEFGGLPITAAEIDTDLYRMRSIWMIESGTFLALREDDPEPSLDENLNHSCDANAWLDGDVVLVARRDIEAGEEITLDQGTWNIDEDEYVWDQDGCSCGAPVCRGVLTANDWKLPEVRRRYAGHFHPVLQRLIDAGNPR